MSYKTIRIVNILSSDTFFDASGSSRAERLCNLLLNMLFLPGGVCVGGTPIYWPQYTSMCCWKGYGFQAIYSGI